MDLKRIGFVAMCALAVGAAGVEAGTITAPIGISATTMATADGSLTLTIDQSGLSAGYTSLVTDFDTYIAGSPTHASPGPSNAWSSSSSQIPGSIDFDLGSLRTIEDVVLWNSFSGFGINSFSIFTATNAAFVGAVNVGSFNAIETFAPMAAQVFSLTVSDGRYVRLVINSNHSQGATNVNLSEIAFDTTSPVPVPEPATLLLLGSGLAAAGLRRRTKKRS